MISGFRSPWEAVFMDLVYKNTFKHNEKTNHFCKHKHPKIVKNGKDAAREMMKTRLKFCENL